MARRKRKEEEPVWKPPEFDEVGYMRQEIENAKIAVVVIAWAVVGAILAYLLALWIPIVGYLAGLAVFGALYFVLPALGLPIHGFKRRDWMSHASIYFFSWLAFSIILLNAPFGDHTSPTVGSFEVGSFNSIGSLTAPDANSTFCTPVDNGATAQPYVSGSANKTLYILFRATDNVGVATIQVQIGNQDVNYTDVSGQPSACAASPAQSSPPSTYAVTTAVGRPSYTVRVTAVDTSGLSTAASITIVLK